MLPKMILLLVPEIIHPRTERISTSSVQLVDLLVVASVRPVGFRPFSNNLVPNGC